MTPDDFVAALEGERREADAVRDRLRVDQLTAALVALRSVPGRGGAPSPDGEPASDRGGRASNRAGTQRQGIAEAGDTNPSTQEDEQ